MLEAFGVRLAAFRSDISPLQEGPFGDLFLPSLLHGKGTGMLVEVLTFSTFPGAAGGLACFLVALKKRRIKNNRHVRKAVLEVFGGLLVASFVGPLFLHQPPSIVVSASFALGGSWATVMQVLRRRITAIAEAALGNLRDSEERG